ncbi:MAG: prephenate dehydrogenase/arogenate dehydrogenase family protein [Thaumarchaeota archaeon]|nr:prephenate dehydrogenase/arogenate dehydrogenase family protein [Nitrososphaerota archaeon]MCL5318723.1 prephenate dehydrogenase/arogenate dehydrogenase family protein [Nitrososphaerota archaeon]
MKVAVIGAAGRMGRWFTGYFTEKKMETTIYDIDTKHAEETAAAYKARLAKDLNSAVADADVIIVSVPISATSDIVSQVLKIAKRGAVVAEITSFKQSILPSLKQVKRSDVKILSIHPMFGHGAKSLSGHRIVIVPLRDAAEEADLTRKLFPEAEVISASAEAHDSAMATVLSLTHFTNLAFAAALPDDGIEKIRQLSGTSFNMQMTLAESILQDDPEFLAALQVDGKNTSVLIGRLVQEAEALLALVEGKNKRELAAKIRSLQQKMKKDPEFEKAYKKMYDIMDILLES